MPKKKLLFLFSDTGGGHRSSAEAVEEALNHLYPNQFEITKIDFLRHYSPWPFNQLVSLYPKMLLGNGFFWQIGFNLSNHPQICKLLLNFFWPYVKPRIQRLFSDHSADLIVSFHPLINFYLKKLNLSHVLTITDLVTAHTFWYLGHPDHIFAPTQQIVNTGIKLGLNPNLFQITGLPISLRFAPKIKRGSLHEQKSKIKTVLLMGGGQGMGKIFAIAKSLNSANLPLKLIVVAGRNPKLESKLKAVNWKIPAEIYGFTKEIPNLMQKSDILITKAGPSTVCEGLVVGLPVIIYDYLPGQETATVDYLVNNHAGLYCPTPNSVIAALKSANFSQLSKSAKLLAKPNAAIRIAQKLYRLVS